VFHLPADNDRLRVFAQEREDVGRLLQAKGDRNDGLICGLRGARSA
jgi:hypothetical protein